MYAPDIIEKYFTKSTDETLNVFFWKGAGFFHLPDCIHYYEQLHNKMVVIHFEEYQQFSNMPIVKNNIVVGQYQLSEPHTIIHRGGSFLCEGVSRLKQYPVLNEKNRRPNIRVSKGFFTRALTVKISNRFVNIKFKCKTMMPLNYYSNSIKTPSQMNEGS